MVLGFGRRSTNKKGADEGAIKISPSLPDLAQAQQSIPWPANLVDPNAVNEARSQPLSSAPSKMSFQAIRGAIPFHKPFKGGDQATVDGDGSIAAIYQQKQPPSAFNRSSAHSMYSYQRSQRRPRVAPTFNLMVAGGQGTGKTSLLRLLIDTCDVSPNATADQRAGVERFVQSSARATRALQTACIEICETKHDRVLLTVIDTPGLDFAQGAELGLERSVSGIVKYLDLQFAETMGEESKVVRQNKGDQHVHLCIYLIEPESVVTPALRRAKLALPRLTRSQTSLRYRPDDLSSVSSGESSDSSSEDEDAPASPRATGKAADRHKLTMNPAEIRVIKRLATRVNVLPVIARADSLTDEKLASIKRAVRRDLLEAGIGFGVFDNRDAEGKKSHRRPKGQAQTDPGPDVPAATEEEPTEERKVIQIKKGRFATLTRSRSKRNLQEVDAELFGESHQPVVVGEDGPPQTHQARDAAALLPFAVIAPELPRVKHHRRAHKKSVNGIGNGTAHPVAPATDDGHQSIIASSPEPPELDSSSAAERRRSTGGLDFTAPSSPAGQSTYNGQSGLSYLMSPQHVNMRGRFLRKFRWGTVDVLDPQHCDFAALRTAVLSTHLKALKASTKDVLYEQFRTEKLLARRATRNINDEDRKRLLADLGI